MAKVDSPHTDDRVRTNGSRCGRQPAELGQGRYVRAHRSGGGSSYLLSRGKGFRLEYSTLAALAPAALEIIKWNPKVTLWGTLTKLTAAAPAPKMRKRRGRAGHGPGSRGRNDGI